MKKDSKTDNQQSSNGLMSWYKKYDDSKGGCKRCNRTKKKGDRASDPENHQSKDETVAHTKKDVKECRKDEICKKKLPRESKDGK